MTRKQIQQVESAWYSIENAVPSHDLTRYLQTHEEEERGHRKFAPGGYRAPISVPVAAKLMAVQYICEFLNGSRPLPLIREYFHIRPTLYMAAALISNYRNEIETALIGHDVEALAALDYAAIMNPQVVA